MKPHSDSLSGRALRMAHETCKLFGLAGTQRSAILAWGDAFLRRERRREVAELGYQDLGGEG